MNTAAAFPDITFIRVSAVAEQTGRSRSTCYTDVKEGLLTKPVEISVGHSAWPKHEIQAILRTRLAGKTNDDIRALVKQLHAERLLAA